MVQSNVFLTQHLQEKYSEREARDVVRTLTEAIAYCHSQCVVHRDLKVSAGLMLRRTGISPSTAGEHSAAGCVSRRTDQGGRLRFCEDIRQRIRSHAAHAVWHAWLRRPRTAVRPAVRQGGGHLEPRRHHLYFAVWISTICRFKSGTYGWTVVLGVRAADNNIVTGGPGPTTVTCPPPLRFTLSRGGVDCSAEAIV